MAAAVPPTRTAPGIRCWRCRSAASSLSQSGRSSCCDPIMGILTRHTGDGKRATRCQFFRGDRKALRLLAGQGLAPAYVILQKPLIGGCNRLNLGRDPCHIPAGEHKVELVRAEIGVYAIAYAAAAR